VSEGLAHHDEEGMEERAHYGSQGVEKRGYRKGTGKDIIPEDTHPVTYFLQLPPHSNFQHFPIMSSY
jgi:hypothetical protein